MPDGSGAPGAREDGPAEAPELERHDGAPVDVVRIGDAGEQGEDAPSRHHSHHRHHHHYHSSRRRQRRHDDAADDSDDSLAERGGLLSMREREDGSMFDMEIAGDEDELVLAVEEAATAREMEGRARGEESASSERKSDSSDSSSSESEGEAVGRSGLLRARTHDSSGAGAASGGSPAARWRQTEEPEEGDLEAGFERRLTRLNSEMDELIVDSFNEHYSEGWKMKAATTVLQVGVLVTFLAVLVYSVQQVFPDLKEQLKSWASWANGQGDRGAVAFSLGAALIMLVPGVPGSLLCFTCGTVFPFGRALLIAAAGHHIGACLAFVIARVACRTRFEKLLVTRPTLKTMSAAAKIQQWKVTFLSRFIVMPVQIKNYRKCNAAFRSGRLGSARLGLGRAAGKIAYALRVPLMH
jgi:hypothetical protein